MKSLVGYTGFVGSNILLKEDFDGKYNSKNIQDSYGTNPELLIYAGLRAEKYLANTAPQKDLDLIIQAEENIERINPQKLVLISTIDVFKSPQSVDENSRIETEGLPPYGYDRYQLEIWVRERYPDALIVRLPGLFGKNIKKNFIYDYINVIPSMLKAEIFNELSGMNPELRKYYERQSNGFYKASVPASERERLKTIFNSLGFSALNFTDSRSIFQFYNLGRLWDDITIALREDIKLLHLATEPISVSELYAFLSQKDFINELPGAPANYDYRTVYDHIFGGSGGYIARKEAVLREIRDFVEAEGSLL